MGPFLRPFTANNTLSGPPLHRDRALFSPCPPPVGGFGVVYTGSGDSLIRCNFARLKKSKIELFIKTSIGVQFSLIAIFLSVLHHVLSQCLCYHLPAISTHTGKLK